jgi:hypothetical protein
MIPTITAISIIENYNRALTERPVIQSNPHTQASLNLYVPATGQSSAKSFQSSEVERPVTVHNNEPTDPASPRQSNAHSAQAPSPNSEYPVKDKLAAKPFQSSNESSGHNASRNPDGGWQYCLATSPADHKVYVSVPFPKTAKLNIIIIAFSQRLVDLQHEAVQCPVSKYKGSIATMREDAISFNRKIGNAIVTLNWQPFSFSEDEDPIDAAIYTGEAGTILDHGAAWQYCVATSYAENKVYISAPFPKSASLHANETAFSKKLLETKIRADAVQCPGGSDKSSILTMRQRAISFNQDRGNMIVTLDWTLQNHAGG